jgi:hypothetical protein
LSEDLPGASGTGIGFGKANTGAIINSNGEGSYWALICQNYSQGGYADWFMPSKDEIQRMTDVVTSLNLPSVYGIVSSSQYDSSYCWAIADHFSGDKWNAIRKYYVYGGDGYVTRPIRQF